MSVSSRPASSSFALSLRPWPAEEKETNSLASLIGRIHEHRGHFRNVTEQALEEEIASLKESNAQDRDSAKEDLAGEFRNIRKEIAEVSAGLSKGLAKANEETQVSLDFVSLLLSRDRAASADASMSLALKQATPYGCLSADVMRASPSNDAGQQDLYQTSVGATLRSLSAGADFVLEKAQELEREIQRETKYWEEVLSIHSKGWSVCRVPQEKHVLGVHFGFSEAMPEFKAQGFAPLRSDSNGGIILDQAICCQPQMVRVRIEQAGKIVGTSRLSRLSGIMQAPIEHLISHARDTLFEGELFQSLAKEAHSLLSYNVKMKHGIIHIPISPLGGSGQQRAVLIDLVSRDPETQGLAIDDRPLDAMADRISLFLRILLSHVHYRNYRRRTALPMPLSDKSTPTPSWTILRQVVAHLRHAAHSESLHDLIKSHLALLRSAKLDGSIRFQGLHHLKNATRAANCTASYLLEAQSKPLVSSLSLSLPGNVDLTIKVLTSINEPGFGTTYSVTSTLTDNRETACRSYVEMEKYIQEVIPGAVAREVSNRLAGWKLNGHSLKYCDEHGRKKMTASTQVQGHGSERKLMLVWNAVHDRGDEMWEMSSRSGTRKGILEVIDELSRA